MPAGWEGMDEMLDDLDAMVENADPALDASLRVQGEALMTDVKASRPGKGVPVDTGALRSSGTVEGPDNHKVEVSFGGPAAPYALAQHERLDYSHSVGESRYLVRGWRRLKQSGSVRKALKNALDELAEAQRIQRFIAKTSA